jgi:TatA/E family protein of Tat protein translocase
MNFLGMGPGELLVILVLALIIFGPRRLPEIGQSLGKSIREFREASQQITSQFTDELQAASKELQADLESAVSAETEKPPQPGKDKQEPLG